MTTSLTAPLEKVRDEMTTSPIAPLEEYNQREMDYETRLFRHKKVRDEMTSSPIAPLVLKLPGGEQVAAVFTHETQNDELDTLRVFSTVQFNCRECGIRARHFGNLSDTEGPLFFNAKTVKKITDHDLELYKKMGDVTKKITSGPITDIVLVKGRYVSGVQPIKGESATTGEIFRHWAFTIADTDMTTNGISDAKLELIESALHRYIPENLPSMIKKLVGSDTQGAINSLEMMEQCCHQATYGNKWLPALRWVLDIVKGLKSQYMSQRETWAFFAQHLLKAPISKDLYGAVCPFYHTVNSNIIDLLRSAKTKEGMTKLIKERLSPLTYQRRDPNANLAEGEINIAIKHLGEFSNSVMTMEEVSKQPHAVVLGATPSSSMKGFQTLLSKAAKKPDIDSPSGFAARAGSHGVAAKIKTMDQLLTFLENNPGTKLEMRTDDWRLCYVAKTTLKEEARCHPHFWGFSQHRGALQLGLSIWAEVTGILPMYKYIEGYGNIVFFFRGSRVPHGVIGNCNFPELLSSEYKRTCGKAFERLNTLSKIEIPEGPIAVGLGMSSVNEMKTFNKKVWLRIEGIEIAIDRIA